MTTQKLRQLQGLLHERLTELESETTALRAVKVTVPTRTYRKRKASTEVEPAPKARRRRMSKAARAKASRHMKARWKKLKTNGQKTLAAS